MLSYISLLRPTYGVAAAAAVLFGGLIAAGTLDALVFPRLVVAMVAAFLIAGAGSTVNNFVDFEADKVDKPGRPLPCGKLSRKKAIAFSAILFLVSIILAGFVNTVVFAIAIINTIVLIIYSTSLQNKILIRNLVASYLVASAFLFGGAAAGSIPLSGMLSLLVFFAFFSRRVVNDMRDIEGDRAGFLKRLAGKALEMTELSSMEPSLKHKKRIIFLAELSLVLAIIVSPLPYLLEIVTSSYVVFLVPAAFLFFLSLALLLVSERRAGLKDKVKSMLFGKKFYRDISRYIRIGLAFLLLAFFAGIFL